MNFKESMNNILSFAIDKAVCAILDFKDKVDSDTVEDAEYDFVVAEEPTEIMDIHTLIYSDELKTILPRLQFELSLDRPNASITSGIHSTDMQMDIYFVFEFILSLTGSMSINLEARYLQEGESNTKYLVRNISSEEFEILGISMSYDFTNRIIYATLSDSKFEIKLNEMLECISILHTIDGNYVSSIRK